MAIGKMLRLTCRVRNRLLFRMRSKHFNVSKQPSINSSSLRIKYFPFKLLDLPQIVPAPIDAYKARFLWG